MNWLVNTCQRFVKAIGDLPFSEGHCCLVGLVSLSLTSDVSISWSQNPSLDRALGEFVQGACNDLVIIEEDLMCH